MDGMVEGIRTCSLYCCKLTFRGWRTGAFGEADLLPELCSAATVLLYLTAGIKSSGISVI